MIPGSTPGEVALGLARSGSVGFGATEYLEALGIKPDDRSETAFVQRVLTNKRDNPDALYDQYLKGVQLPANLPTHVKETGLFPALMRGMRRAVPFVDTAVGHQDLNDALSAWPFTPEARKLLTGTLVRSSMSPQVVQEEAETNPEKYLGLRTGRLRTDIAEGGFVSPPLSVLTHELMHSYLDLKGYPRDEDAFNQAWEAAKPHNPLLQTIDSWVAADYADEMNRGDITQERYAYLAQALGGAGLQAFPKELQPD
jgi:hypothetical protein